MHFISQNVKTHHPIPFFLFLPSNLFRISRKVLDNSICFHSSSTGQSNWPWRGLILGPHWLSSRHLGLWRVSFNDFNGSQKTINPLQKWPHLCSTNAVGVSPRFFIENNLTKNYGYFYTFLYLKLLFAGVRNTGVTWQCFFIFHSYGTKCMWFSRGKFNLMSVVE